MQVRETPAGPPLARPATLPKTRISDGGGLADVSAPLLLPPSGSGGALFRLADPEAVRSPSAPARLGALRRGPVAELPLGEAGIRALWIGATLFGAAAHASASLEPGLAWDREHDGPRGLRIRVRRYALQAQIDGLPRDLAGRARIEVARPWGEGRGGGVLGTQLALVWHTPWLYAPARRSKPAFGGGLPARAGRGRG